MILSTQECERLLLNRIAVIVLGIAGVLSIGAILIGHSDLNSWGLSQLRWEALSYTAAASAFGAVSILAAMFLFWVKCDKSSKRSRTVWFFILLFGLIYGAIPYYFLVYLPAVRNALRRSEGARNV